MEAITSYKSVSPISIKNNKTIPTNKLDSPLEYGLKSNFFNPNKDSPPNIFLDKCKNRLNDYYKSK